MKKHRYFFLKIMKTKHLNVLKLYLLFEIVILNH